MLKSRMKYTQLGIFDMDFIILWKTFLHQDS